MRIRGTRGMKGERYIRRVECVEEDGFTIGTVVVESLWCFAQETGEAASEWLRTIDNVPGIYMISG